MTRPVAVLDANVLYGIVPTDLLVTLAIRGIYRPHWTDAILDEAIRNITTNRPDLDPTDIARRFELMNRALPSATVPPAAGSGKEFGVVARRIIPGKKQRRLTCSRTGPRCIHAT